MEAHDVKSLKCDWCVSFSGTSDTVSYETMIVYSQYSAFDGRLNSIYTPVLLFLLCGLVKDRNCLWLSHRNLQNTKIL